MPLTDNSNSSDIGLTNGGGAVSFIVLTRGSLNRKRTSSVNKIYDYDVILIGLGECENISLFDEIYIVRDNNLVGIARAAKVFDHCALCKITLKRT